MIIPINIPSNSQTTKLPAGLVDLSHDEVVLIELQGSLEIQCDDVRERDGKLVGTLKLDETNKPTLLIGHHLLEGKIVNLIKPLAVIRRSRSSSTSTSKPSVEPDDDSEAMEVDMPELSSPRKGVEWNVAAIVRKKILFSKRPMPMVNLTK